MATKEMTFNEFLIVIDEYIKKQAAIKVLRIPNSIQELMGYSQFLKRFAFLKQYRITRTFIQNFLQKDFFTIESFDNIRVTFDEDTVTQQVRDDFMNFRTKTVPFIEAQLKKKWDVLVKDENIRFFVYFYVYFYYIMLFYMMFKSLMISNKLEMKTIDDGSDWKVGSVASGHALMMQHLSDKTMMKRTWLKLLNPDIDFKTKMDLFERQFMRFFAITIV